MSSIAEFYSRNLANEVIKGSVQTAKAGGTLGKAPTGYLNVRKMENGGRSAPSKSTRSGARSCWAFPEYATGKWNLRDLLAEATKRASPASGRLNALFVVRRLSARARTSAFSRVEEASCAKIAETWCSMVRGDMITRSPSSDTVTRNGRTFLDWRRRWPLRNTSSCSRR